jgi:hypothetical protein
VTALRYRDVRRKRQGFKVHADRHIEPEAHGFTEDTIFHAPRTQMRGQGKTVWTRSDNRNIGSWFHPNRHSSMLALFGIDAEVAHRRAPEAGLSTMRL